MGLVCACSSTGDPGDGDSSGASGGTSGSGSGRGSGGLVGVGGTHLSSGGVDGSGAGMQAGGDGPAAGGSEAGAGGAPVARECENNAPALSVALVSATTVSELGVLFATEMADNSGPTSWASRYGKTPEIVAVPDGEALAVLLQDQMSSELAHLVHLAPSGSGFALDAAYEVESLGRIMGLALDEKGNYFVATGVDEDEEVDATYPPNDIHRKDIVRVVKFDRSGCVLMESDVDMARGTADAESEIIVNPMVAGSSRLAYGAGQLALVHSHNTEPDPDLDGTRHQKAITTHIDAETGQVTRASTLWVSHSFDQRAFFDGTGLLELHLGDAYPRTVALGRYLGAGKGVARDLFHIKGPVGDNNTFTRLGGIAQVPDPEFGYLVVFATERTSGFDGDAEIQGTRDLALVRVRAELAEVSGSVIDTGDGTSEFSVNSANKDLTNHVRWLTSLAEDRHVERPRIVSLAGEGAIVLWEEWTVSGNRSTFEGTFALRLDTAGTVTTGPLQLSGFGHISRGDDAVTLGGRALYVGGSSAGLELNFIAPDLTAETVVVP